jgi:hypothetical protein
MPSFPAFVIKIKVSAKLTFDPYKICQALTLILIYFDSRLYWYSYSWVSWPLSQYKTERPRNPRINFNFNYISWKTRHKFTNIVCNLCIALLSLIFE